MEIKYFTNDKDYIKIDELSGFIKRMDEFFIDPIFKRDYFISYEQLANNFLNNANYIYCKNNDNQLMGIVVFYADNKKYDYAFEAYIAVLKEFNGQGIAAELIKNEIDCCFKIGMKGLMTNCNPGNNAKINLNKKMGFTEITDQEEEEYFHKLNSKWLGKLFYKLTFNDKNSDK